MALQLHEWLDKFIEAHGLDTDIENTENVELYVLHSIISDELTGIYKNRYPNVKCLTLKEWIAYDKKTRDTYEAEPLTDFIYERKSGYVLINLRFNSSLPHENLMAYMHNAIEGKHMREPDGAEAFIDKYGFSLSSTSYHRTISLGENFTLTAQEKVAFSAYNFVR
jgi:hypothetical protein